MQIAYFRKGQGLLRRMSVSLNLSLSHIESPRDYRNTCGRDVECYGTLLFTRDKTEYVHR
ncbi:hypothetical protein K503DRAFT_772659, partial [Rhizopogon vinicolor AM-OR11-026]